MPPDPLDALRQPPTPVLPRPAFAADLRRRIEQALAELDPTPEANDPEDDMPSTKPSTPTAVRVTLTPYLIVTGASDAIEFYKSAFGAVETMRIMQPDGRVGHAEIAIGEVTVMLADEFPEMGLLGPKTVGHTTVLLTLVVPNADELFERAVAAGATVERPPADQFHGSRTATIVDPAGHRWTLSTPIEEVSAEEMQRRAAAIGNDELG